MTAPHRNTTRPTGRGNTNDPKHTPTRRKTTPNPLPDILIATTTLTALTYALILATPHLISGTPLQTQDWPPLILTLTGLTVLTYRCRRHH